MSVMVTIEAPTKSEKLEEFLGFLKEGLVATRSFKGCQKVDTYVDHERSSVFLVELWDSLQDQEAYMAWRVDTGLLEAISPFLSASLIVRSFEIKEDV